MKVEVEKLCSQQRITYWKFIISFNSTRSLLDDVIKWKHFPRYWPFVRGIDRSPVNSPHKGQWRGALMFSLICAWINVWINNREAADLIRHRAHHDVRVMIILVYTWNIPPRGAHSSRYVVFVVECYWKMLSISLKVYSLSLGQSHNCSRASEATITHIDK